MAESNVIIESTKLDKVIQETGLMPSTQSEIKKGFFEFFEQAEEWKTKSEQLIVTDASQTDLMKEAREGRLFLKTIRVQADKKRKELKADSLSYSKAVQGAYNVLEHMIVPIEAHLKKQEKFLLIQKEKEELKLKIEREDIAEPYKEFLPFNLNYGTMEQESFERLINGAKLQLDQQKKDEAEAEKLRIKAEQDKAEAERKAKIEADRIKAENAKLQKEALEKEKAAKIEADKRAKIEADRLAKEKAERKAQAEKEAKAKAEADAKIEAERQKRITIEKELQAEKERQEAIQRAEAAKLEAELQKGDAEKILDLCKDLKGLKDKYSFESEKNINTMINVKALLDKIVTYIESK